MGEQATAKIRENAARKPLVSGLGTVSCARPKSASVYDIRGGGCGVTAIVCTVPYHDTRIDVNVAAKFDPKTGQVTFKASMPQRIAFDSDTLEDGFLAHAENSAQSWNGFVAAQTAAVAKLREKLDPTAKPSGELAPDMRPRLVMPLTVKPAVSTPAA